MFCFFTLILGLGFGIYAPLIPGFSLSLPLSVGVGLGLGGVEGAVFIAAANGAALYTKRLALVMHPNANNGSLGSLDPILKMIALNRGREALTIMTYTTTKALHVLGILGLIIGFLCITHMPFDQVIKYCLSWLTKVIIPLWLIYTCYRSKRWFMTACGFLLTGLFGWWVMHNPWISGGENQIAPILIGLFGLPMAWQALEHGNDKPIPLDWLVIPVQVDRDIVHTGIGIGALAGFLPGLGAGSLVGMTYDLYQNDDELVIATTSAEAANDVMSLILTLATGMARSGEAVMLKACLGASNPLAIALVIIASIWGCYQGFRFVENNATWYSKTICKYRQTHIIKFVIGMSLIPIVLCGGLTIIGQLSAWCGLGAGLLISGFCRHWHLPNQVAFGALTLPIMFSDWGLGALMNKVLFGI